MSPELCVFLWSLFEEEEDAVIPHSSHRVSHPAGFYLSPFILLFYSSTCIYHVVRGSCMRVESSFISYLFIFRPILERVESSSIMAACPEPCMCVLTLSKHPCLCLHPPRLHPLLSSSSPPLCMHAVDHSVTLHPHPTRCARPLLTMWCSVIGCLADLRTTAGP